MFQLVPIQRALFGTFVFPWPPASATIRALLLGHLLGQAG
jgi:hypothetical protein